MTSVWTALTAGQATAVLDRCHTPVPLQQHPAYGLAVSGAAKPHWLAWQPAETDGPAAIAQLIERRFLGLVTVENLMRGPVWLTATPDPAAYRALALRQRLLGWRFMLQMPELADTPAVQRLMHRAGRRRIMTGFATLWKDLHPADLRASLKGKWRNQLRRAEAAGLTLGMTRGDTAERHWLLEQEAAQRTARRYQALPLAFVPAYEAAMQRLDGHKARAALTVVAKRRGERVAGALFLLHGTSATYHIGWNGPTGRACHAQNLVLYQAMTALAEHGVRWLDMGGLNSGPLAAISHFKAGVGGLPLRLAGSFL